MFVEQNVYVGARDVNSLKQLNNTSLLSYLENAACYHSELAGFGITNMDITKRTWILLSWKVKVFKRPIFNEKLKVRTWSRLIEKIYAYRDFEIYNENDELIAIASSKWVFVDTENGKILRITDDIIEKYNQEDKNVFNEKDIEKLKEPEEFINKIDYKISRNMIDVNKHLHNIYYMDIAKEALPEDIFFSDELNEFEVMYKTEIKFGENVKVLYSKKDDYNYITIKSEDESKLHAIIRLK